MTNYNLPKRVDYLIKRLEAKVISDGYGIFYILLSDLKKLRWYTMPISKQIKTLIGVINGYQIIAPNAELQEIIDDIKPLNFFNLLHNTKQIEKAVILIESI